MINKDEFIGAQNKEEEKTDKGRTILDRVGGGRGETYQGDPGTDQGPAGTDQGQPGTGHGQPGTKQGQPGTSGIIGKIPLI